MKIINLTEDSKIYTSNVYLVMGQWNTVKDLNTLIDVGSDLSIIGKIENINTGLGKNKIDQVVLTHSHSDHSAILYDIKEIYEPKVYAFNTQLKYVDKKLNDGDEIQIGDKYFEVFHITTHSYDSICLFCKENGILFSGDTNFPVQFDNPTLKMENIEVLERLEKKIIKIIYPGHGRIIKSSEKEIKIINN